MPKLPPWLNPRSHADPVVEGALIGMVLHARRIPPALQRLQAHHFHDPRHRALWTAILSLHEADPQAVLGVSQVVDHTVIGTDDAGRIDLDSLVTLEQAQLLADTQPGLDMAPFYVSRLLNAHNKFHLWGLTVHALKLICQESSAKTSAEELRRRVVTALEEPDFSDAYQKPATWADLQARVKALRWDWPGWLPRGCLVLLAGASGIGKSLLALRLAATYLRGDPWPDGTQPDLLGPAAVLWCESETAQFLNVQRARAWGLPCDQIWAPLRAAQDVRLDHPEHRGEIARLAAHPGVRLIVVDSLSGVSQGAETAPASHGGARGGSGAVQWLAELARDTRKPVLLLHHLRKGGSGARANRPGVSVDDLRGHSSIVQPARIVLALDAPDPLRPHLKRLYVIKSNLAAPPPPLGLYVDSAPALGGAQLCFCDPPQPPQATTLLAQTIELLRELLSRGPLPAALIRQELEQAGISMRTAHRAKAHLGIRSARQPDGRWIWRLPANPAERPLLEPPTSPGPTPNKAS